MANVTPSLVLSELQQPDASSYTTAAAVAIPANQVTLLFIDAAGTSSLAAPTSVTQTGVTWDFVASSTAGVNTTPAVHLYRCAPATAQSATITVNFAETKTSCNFTVITCANSNPGSNGASGVVTPVHTENASGTTISVTLATPKASTSAAVGFFRAANAGSPTLGSGITSLSNVSGSAPSSRHISMWKQNTTLLDMSGVSGVTRLMGVEVTAPLEFTGTDTVGLVDSASVAKAIDVVSTPAVVQYQPQVNAGATSHTVTLPSTPTPGNLMVVAFRPGTSSLNFSGPAGWTQAVLQDDGLSLSISLWYRIAQSGDSAAVTFTTGTSVGSQMEAYEVSGIAGSPLDAVVALDGPTASSLAMTSTATLAQPGEWAVTATAQAGDNGGSEAVDSGFTVRDAATLTSMIVADQVVAATTALAPTHSWTTARNCSGVTATFRANLVGIVDSATVVHDFVVTGTDPVGIVDSGTVGSVLSQVGTDAIGIVDSIVVDLIQVIAVTGTDPVGLTDSATAEIQAGVLGTDPTGIVDLATVVVGYAATFTDAVGIVDSLTVETSGLAATGTDPVGISDSKTVEITTEGFGDPIGIIDGLTVTVTPIIAVTGSDPIGLVDSASVTMNYAVTGSDPIGFVDSTTSTSSYAVSGTDTIWAADTPTVERAMILTFSDAIGLTDLSVVGQVLAFTDVVGITDDIGIDGSVVSLEMWGSVPI